MEKISEFLERFKKTLFSNETNKDVFKDSIFDCLGILIKTENLLIKNNHIYIKCDSVVKNEIIINKQKILLLFYKKGGSTKISKIK